MAGSHCVTVCCTSDDNNDRVYRCPSSVTAGDILERWTNDLGLQKDAASLRRPNGSLYDVQEPLFEQDEGTTIVQVFAELAWRFLVSLSTGEDHEVFTNSGSTPRELLGHLRANLGLSDSRPMRLVHDTTVLQLDKGFKDQEVHSDIQLSLEFGYAGLVTEAVSGVKRPFQFFAAEPAARLVEPWLPSECRLRAMKDGALIPISLCGDVGAALGSLDDAEGLQLELELRLGVAVLTAGHSRPQVVPAWTGTAVGDLLDALEPPPRALPQVSLYDGDLAPHDQSLSAGSGAVIAADSVPIKLWLKRRCRLLRLACHSTVADLRALATAQLGLPPNGTLKALLRIKNGRQVDSKDDPRPLAAFCIDHGDSFNAEKPAHPKASRPHLSVGLSDGRCFELPLGPGELLRFGELVSRLASAAGEPRSEFRFRVFRCCGCGRGLDVKEEEFQVVPAPCCRHRSLTLRERRTACAGVQSGIVERHKVESATNTFQEVGENTKDASVTAKPNCVDKNVGGGPKKTFRTIGSQTKKAGAEPKRKATEPKSAAAANATQANIRAGAQASSSANIQAAQTASPPIKINLAPAQSSSAINLGPSSSAINLGPPSSAINLGPSSSAMAMGGPPSSAMAMGGPSSSAMALGGPPSSAMVMRGLVAQPLMSAQAAQPPRGQQPLGATAIPSMRIAPEQNWQQNWQQEQVQLDQLMALNPGLQVTEAQLRNRLATQLGQRIPTRPRDDVAASEFERRLQEEQKAVERRMMEALERGDTQSKPGPRPDAARKQPLAHKSRQSAEEDSRHRPQPDPMASQRSDDYRPRARQRQAETRQEKRQRRLQELRDQFESEKKGAADNLHHFYISSLIRGRPDFNCRLRLPNVPTVGDVRRELALEMEVPPARLRLRRSSAIRDNKRLFRIHCPNNENQFLARSFGDQDGMLYALDAKTPTEVRFLDDDEELFPMVPGKTCIVEASCTR